MTTDIEQVSQALTDYSKVEAGLAALREKFAGVVYPVTTTEGMDAAKRARLTLREPRYEIERVRKAAKSPLLALGKRLDAEAERITKEILAIEVPIDAQIKREEDRKEAERQAKIAAEQCRVEDIQKRIQAIRDFAAQAVGCTSREIAILVSNVTLISIDKVAFEEFHQQALDAYHGTIGKLREMEERAKQAEAEAARLAAERVELERLRREAAERERLERETRQTEERRQQAERDRIALEERQARERVAEEQKRLDAQRVDQERREAALREAEKPKPVPAGFVSDGALAECVPPSDSDLVRAVQDTFGCTATVAIGWVIAAGLRLARDRMDAEA